MPYGFIQHIESKGYSDETISSYKRVVTQFFNFIKFAYPDNKEPFQISAADIKNYLLEQKEGRDKSISTINKELAIIKTMFHYFWEINKVPIDPTVKIMRFTNMNKPSVDISYEEILKVKNIVLSNNNYSTVRKVIYLLATKGLKSSEFRFKKNDVRDNLEKDMVEIKLKNRHIILEGQEATYFQEYYYESLTNGSEYVFITRPHGEEEGAPVQAMTIIHHLRAISKEYFKEVNFPLNLTLIRRAIAFDMYQKNLPIQIIAKELGIEENTASNYLKNIKLKSRS
ncbi:tyrosine-type recombinase/integrase [Cytobacillus pseudoceanisediminis]|uniref:tyrosine-type recombinase/integrase n=1 Tax=Cytobacillus pseudoceanisediminis TaxID=3051614 RepID=UPI003C30ADA3